MHYSNNIMVKCLGFKQYGNGAPCPARENCRRVSAIWTGDRWAKFWRPDDIRNGKDCFLRKDDV